jgi:selenocysteine lyase/cysteine desulfurase
MRGSCLVAHVEQTNAETIAGLVDVRGVAAREREHYVHPLLHKLPYYELTTMYVGHPSLLPGRFR